MKIGRLGVCVVFEQVKWLNHKSTVCTTALTHNLNLRTHLGLAYTLNPNICYFPVTASYCVERSKLWKATASAF